MLFKNNKTGNILAVTDKMTIELMTKKSDLYTPYKPPRTKPPKKESTEGESKSNK